MTKPSTLAPQAEKRPHRTEIHGDVLIDDYFWLREKTNPEVIDHLKAENAYTAKQLEPVANLRERLFHEMKARLKEDDADVPYKHGAYYYYSRLAPGLQYPIKCRKLGSLDSPEEILLDCNSLAEGKKYFKLRVFEVSPDHEWLAYACDFDGSERYTIFFKNLKNAQLAPESISGASESLAWANDNRTVFYTMLDEHERPDRLLRHVVGTAPSTDRTIHKEADPQLFVYCSKSRSERFVLLEMQGKVTSEIHFLDAFDAEGDFKVIEPRQRGRLYFADHAEESFFIVTNDIVQNFRLVQAPVDAPSARNWKELKRGDADLFVEECDAFKEILILRERERGLPRLRVINLHDRSEHMVQFPEPTYTLAGQINAEYDSRIYRFSYSSLVTPTTVFDYHVDARKLEVKKKQEIPSGYNPDAYRSERVFAMAGDGLKIPVSIVYKHENGRTPKDRPLYLIGYGSYGIPINPTFSTVRLSLLDRGFTVAIAHIRGGSELGRQWYEDGKFLKKKNTFTDFIAAAEFLIQSHYTYRGGIAIVGGSAGGLLVGNVVNQRPELFKAAVAHVPFVDVVNTMLDETLPLTTIEFEEWGNPKDRTYYEYIRSYSPYENVREQGYPHMLVTSGLNDPRVTYWEPAKWVARLREKKTDMNLLLQNIDLEAGHGGPSGRYESLKHTALEYAFLLMVFDLAEKDIEKPT